MSDEKLDLIIKQLGDLQTSVGGINTRIDGLDARMSGLETQVSGLDARMGGLETQVSGLDARMSGLEKELGDFKKQVLKSLQTLQARINTLEKQLFAIGFELKEDIKREIKDVREHILGLENKIILQKADRIRDQVVVGEIDLRVLKLELSAA